MTDPFKIGGLLVLTLLGATAIGAAILLARNPELLRSLVQQGAITYNRAMNLLAEWREELGDVMAEALYEAEQALRQADRDEAA
jgi:hypothetical protein